MLKFIIVRITLIILTLLVVSLAIFAITEILPGDVAWHILGQGATPENLEALRVKLDLNKPAYERYVEWIGNAVQGDLGVSYVQNRPVVDIIKTRLYNSAILAAFAFLIGVPLAVLAGIWAGVKKNSVADQLLSTVSLVGISLPEFVTGMLLIVIFATTLRWFPSSSIVLPGTSPLTRPIILILPSLTLTGVLFAYIMRMTRANVIEVMQEKYVRTAILKGLPISRVLVKHVIPNAMLPTISVIATNIGWMIGGLIIVENVFAYPGIGSLLLVSIQSRDVPLLQSLALLIATIYCLSNLLADLSYGLLNPRIRIS